MIIRCDSAAIVPNTSELLPEPETPVNTVSRRFGISTLMSLRLFTRAPCTRIRSWLSATCGAGDCCVPRGLLIVSPSVWVVAAGVTCLPDVAGKVTGRDPKTTCQAWAVNRETALDLVVVDRVHGGFLGAGAGPVDALVLGGQLRVDVLVRPLVGRHQPTGALAADLAADVTVEDVGVRLGLGLGPDLGLLLGQALVEGLPALGVLAGGRSRAPGASSPRRARRRRRGRPGCPRAAAGLLLMARPYRAGPGLEPLRKRARAGSRPGRAAGASSRP